jgi:hypothetical protein
MKMSSLPLVGALVNGLQVLAQDAPHQPAPEPECPIKWPMFFIGFLAGFIVCFLHTWYQDRQRDRRLEKAIDEWDGVSDLD